MYVPGPSRRLFGKVDIRFLKIQWDLRLTVGETLPAFVKALARNEYAFFKMPLGRLGRTNEERLRADSRPEDTQTIKGT